MQEKIPWNADRIREALDHVEAEREKVEELIGPEKVQHTTTLSVTTHGNRRVERAEPGPDAGPPFWSPAAGPGC